MVSTGAIRSVSSTKEAMTRSDRVMNNPNTLSEHNKCKEHRKATAPKRKERRENQGSGIGAKPRLCHWVAPWVTALKLDK